MDANYNLTKIFSNDLVTNTNAWAVSFNTELGGVVGISFLAVVGVVIFVGLKSSGTVNTDTEALSFAGIITSILGIFFLVLGLVSWLYCLPIFVITAISIYLNFTRQNF